MPIPLYPKRLAGSHGVTVGDAPLLETLMAEVRGATALGAGGRHLQMYSRDAGADAVRLM